MAIADYFWSRIENNLDIKNIQEDLIDETDEFFFDENLKEYFKTSFDSHLESQESDDVKLENKNIEIVFKKMLLDLIAELIHDLYLERYENESICKYMPGMRKCLKKQHFKSFVRGPKQIRDAQLVIKNKINSLLKLAEQSSVEMKPSSHHLKSKWRPQKRLNNVDSMLDHEMRDQEYEWSNYEQEEYEAKILISNTIFDMILKDTIDCFQFNILNKINVY